MSRGSRVRMKRQTDCCSSGEGLGFSSSGPQPSPLRQWHRRSAATAARHPFGQPGLERSRTGWRLQRERSRFVMNLTVFV